MPLPSMRRGGGLSAPSLPDDQHLLGNKAGRKVALLLPRFSQHGPELALVVASVSLVRLVIDLFRAAALYHHGTSSMQLLHHELLQELCLVGGGAKVKMELSRRDGPDQVSGTVLELRVEVVLPSQWFQNRLA